MFIHFVSPQSGETGVRLPVHHRACGGTESLPIEGWQRAWLGSVFASDDIREPNQVLPKHTGIDEMSFRPNRDRAGRVGECKNSAFDVGQALNSRVCSRHDSAVDPAIDQ